MATSMARQQERHERHERHEWQEWRNLYEQDHGKTLYFTTATSTHLQQTNGRQTAHTGIYQCTLEPDNNFDDFNDDDESRERCHVASKLGDGFSFAGRRHSAELVLRNLQFDLSSLRSAPRNNERNRIHSINTNDIAGINSNFSNNKKKEKNYLYANTHAFSNDDDSIPDWEIIRAELPHKGDADSDSSPLNSDGTLRFESVFRTIELIDWNECDFDCCIQDDKIYDRWDEEANVDYKHAYARTVVRSFVVDEHTGHVFISWEGYYKDCTSVYASSKKMQWTIGVSRLQMDDPSCTFLDSEKAAAAVYDKDEMDAHFPRCTEPVSIVYQSSRGREVVLPYGGFAVIPSSSIGKVPGNDKRSFLLTVLTSPGIGEGELTSRVWAFPEGRNSPKDGLKRQDLTGPGTVIDAIFMEQNVWDGGTLRLHHNPTTGKPDHLCRSIYNKGIECLPLTVNIRGGIPVVESTGNPEFFLSGEQTSLFCRVADVHRTKRVDWDRKTTLVTGLDVQWDDVTGEPERIFFGCWGGEGGNGNFGSVERDGSNLMRVMDGAYAEAVVFLPKELEGTFHYRDATTTERTAASSATAAPVVAKGHSLVSQSQLVLLLTVLAVACFAIYKRMRLDESRFSVNAMRKELGFRTQYVELQNFDGAPPSSPALSSTEATDEDEDEEVHFML